VAEDLLLIKKRVRLAKQTENKHHRRTRTMYSC